MRNICKFIPCGRFVAAWELCNGHYLQQKRGYSLQLLQADRNTYFELWLQDRITVDPNTDCWLWLNGVNRDGYGCIRIDGKSQSTHRVVFQRLVGLIPTGFQLDHLCRVRSCCNPKHLEIVTSRVNTLRGNTIAANNSKKDFCSNGHVFDLKNTYYRPDRNSRECRICRRVNIQNWRRTEAHPQ